MSIKYLGIDYGEKRMGLATSGALGFVNLLPTFQRNPKDLPNDLKRMGKILEEEGIQEIVIGLPKNMNNTLGFKAEEVLKFVEKFKEMFSLPIHLWDERLTTTQAHQMLQHLSPKKKKDFLDSVSAKIILESFLDAQKVKQQHLSS